MKHKTTCRFLASLAAAFCMFGSCALSASAYTADDVAARARASGWPEYLIQAGYNEWSSGNYSQEQLDAAYASVSSYDEKSGQMMANALGIRYKDDTPAATDAPATDAPTEGSTPDSAAPQKPAATDSITITKNDGTTEERIPKSEFIGMTLEEKQSYIASMTPESQNAFMNSLTPEERNSILKQLPAEDKAALVQTYIDAANGIGMNVAVDSISGSDISLTIRNNSGQVIGQTAVGTIIDETGISHTVPLVTALACAVLAVGMLAVLNKRNREH